MVGLIFITRLYFIGLSILLVAIVSNVIIGRVGLITWYDFGPKFFSNPLMQMKSAGFLNCLWLFFLYPIVLSFGYIIGDRLFRLLF